MATQIQIRHGTSSQWTTANPILMVGEMGVEINTGLFKIGDGTTNWNSLSYSGTNIQGSYLPFLAAADLGGQRVVISDSDGKANYADTTNTTHVNKVLGITTGAVTSGESVKVQFEGIMEDTSWSWTLGNLIYFNSTGVLTQTCPTSGFIQPVAFPIIATKIFISIKQPILI